jgi:hypothetical protein
MHPPDGRWESSRSSDLQRVQDLRLLLESVDMVVDTLGKLRYVSLIPPIHWVGEFLA